MLIDVSLRLKEGMIFRKGSPEFSINELSCFHHEPGNYITSIINTPSHIGTHIDVISKDNSILLDRFIGRGILIDVSNIIGQIKMEDIKNKKSLKKDDFVFFRTDWSQKIENDEYFDHPELSLEVLEWLIDEKINMVGIDALGLGRSKNHGTYDRYLAKHGIFIIENLTNLNLIKKEEFKVYCFPLNIENIEAIPARVVVEV